jgi:cytochrome c-type biogenesis protein CcmH
MKKNLLLLFSVLWFIGIALAQESTPLAPVTYDEINAVAQRMYCPVCENIPLDDCGTATCNQWKNEIGNLLAQGYSEQQIFDVFVSRYGERVLGVPQDPTLRFMSVIVPLAGLVLALIVGFVTFRNWQTTNQKEKPEANVSADDPYRAMLERDINGK